MNTLTCKNYFQTVDIKLGISLTTSPSPTPPTRGDYYHLFGGFPFRSFSMNFYASVEIHGIALGQFYRFVCWWSVAFTQFISYCLDITASWVFFYQQKVFENFLNLYIEFWAMAITEKSCWLEGTKDMKEIPGRWWLPQSIISPLPLDGHLGCFQLPTKQCHNEHLCAKYKYFPKVDRSLEVELLGQGTGPCTFLILVNPAKFPQPSYTLTWIKKEVHFPHIMQLWNY